MSAPFQNIYHRRAVAPHAAKPCFVCYKSTTTVLNQADSKDWFYTCAGHLNDRGFAIPQVDHNAERKEALDREIERVKAEYEVKLKAKKEKEKAKAKGKDGEKSKKIKDDDEPAAEEEEEQDPEAKLKELQAQKDAQGKEPEGPRVFELHKSVYQMRVQKLRARLEAQHQMQRRRNPSFFPSVPKDGI